MLLEKVGFESDPILLFFYDTESVEFLKEIGEKEFREVERALALELFKGSGVDVAESQIELVLAGEADGSQVNTLGEDVAEFDVLVFQGSLLSRLHRITVEDSGPEEMVGISFHTIGIGELGTAVGEEDMDILPEDIAAQDPFQEIDPVLHFQGGILIMIDGEEKTGRKELEGLDKRTVGDVVVDGIHLNDKGVGACGQIALIVFESASDDVLAILALLVFVRLLFGRLAGDLSAKINSDRTVHEMEHVPVDVIVQSLLADTEFRVVVDDLVRRLTLFHKRLDDLGDGLRFLKGQVDAFSGISQGLPILLLSSLGNVAVLGEVAVSPVTASVAGTGRVIPPAAGEGLVVGAVRSTVPPKDAFLVMAAFQRHLTALNDFSVQTDLFTDRGLVFSEGIGDRGLCRFVFYPFTDDTPFLEGQVRKRVLFTHISRSFPTAVR